MADERTILEKIMEMMPDEEFLKADEVFDNAIIGYDTASLRLVYSVSKCIQLLVEEQEMKLDDAIQYFEYNVSGAWVGAQTPIWVQDEFF